MASVKALFTVCGLSLLLCLSLNSARATSDVPAIAAASSIKFALDEIATQFTLDTGSKVRISYGSSGNFVSQIHNGAPFQLFLSGDEDYIQQLQQLEGRADNGVLYAVGRLAIAASKSSPLVLDSSLDGLRDLLSKGELQRFAIANPVHAPYGERAREVLEGIGLWQALQGKLILGENASQAAQFVISGSAQGGIIALSLAKSSQFSALGEFVVLPKSLHEPLNQRMVLTAKAGATAKHFYQYLQSPKARTIFSDFGFDLPPLPIAANLSR